ncbi:DUF6412 domain-containing protein [Amycolatopsis nigrescens]|uniref:DUF6412 domain-containing protein n=1 Tax=Amycolatopsis nigrescens TaxID=381445 RepID=UPI00037FB076|nr:DUF6412 domain-containing protein [Amycolatopsis nigrescens]
MEPLSLFPSMLSLIAPAVHAAAAEFLGNPLGLLAVASVLAASLLVVLVVCHAHGGRQAILPLPVRRRTSALREQTRRTAFLRLRDPGAPGRSRPRAPGFGSLAA